MKDYTDFFLSLYLPCISVIIFFFILPMLLANGVYFEMCMGVLPPYTSMNHVHASCLLKPEEGDRFSGAGGTDSFEQPGDAGN